MDTGALPVGKLHWSHLTRQLPTHETSVGEPGKSQLLPESELGC